MGTGRVRADDVTREEGAEDPKKTRATNQDEGGPVQRALKCSRGWARGLGQWAHWEALRSPYSGSTCNHTRYHKYHYNALVPNCVWDG